MNKATTLAFIGICLLIGLSASDKSSKEVPINNDKLFDIHQELLNNQIYFTTHQVCTACHGFDFDGIANVDNEGNDINPIDDWSSTMMALSAKDPFWRAKVRHEVIINPQFKDEIQDGCVDCHAPIGFYQSLYDGHVHYDFDNIDNDNFALDGVNCAACHQQADEQLGNLFDGELVFDTLYNLYGPFENPLAAPMFSFTGFAPVYSEHINDAGICASCHTLITQTIDVAGNLTNNTFVEQATYHEWENSTYNSTNITCQSCHIPRITDSVLLSSRELFAEKRSPFGLHTLVGGNSFMLKLMKENKAALNIGVVDENFDETIAATIDLLQNHSIELELDFISNVNDSALFKVNIENLTGHKFPSGYPSRRAFIEFIVKKDNGETIFHSGEILPDFEVFGQHPDKEDHYQTISAEDEVQIYEMVFNDTDGNQTTILTRAFESIKDNRIPPKGFTRSHSVYDTVKIVGLANIDPDFNNDGTSEGSGTDDVYYHFSLNGYQGLIDVTARMWYQSAPPKWMEELFATSDPTIDEFETMYDNADQQPVLMAEEVLQNIQVDVGEILEPEIEFYPNPNTNGNVNVSLSVEQSVSNAVVEIYSIEGRLMRTQPIVHNSFILPDEAGVYFVLLKVDGEIIGSERLVRL